ncbi:MAG: hypothetical protein LKG40_00960 [Lachnospiraceae bacterium]|nr:hypothetical protein [Lachnospiraceae bacterium]MCI1328566.1 hypothetical protein [Lachnospiraceae bacterium]
MAPCADEWSACAAEDCDLAASFARAAKKAAEGAAATAEHAARMLWDRFLRSFQKLLNRKRWHKMMGGSF